MMYCSIQLHCVYFLVTYSLPSHVQLILEDLKFKIFNFKTLSCFRFDVNI
jgi:hypothetical protein